MGEERVGSRAWEKDARDRVHVEERTRNSAWRKGARGRITHPACEPIQPSTNPASMPTWLAVCMAVAEGMSSYSMKQVINFKP